MGPIRGWGRFTRSNYHIVGDSCRAIVVTIGDPMFAIEPKPTKVIVGGVEWPKVMDCASEKGPFDTILRCGTA